VDFVITNFHVVVHASLPSQSFVGLCEDRIGKSDLVSRLEVLARLFVLLTKDESVVVISEGEGLNVERDDSFMAFQSLMSLDSDLKMIENK
jgi:hypothetical protein